MSLGEEYCRFGASVPQSPQQALHRARWADMQMPDIAAARAPFLHGAPDRDANRAARRRGLRLRHVFLPGGLNQARGHCGSSIACFIAMNTPTRTATNQTASTALN